MDDKKLAKIQDQAVIDFKLGKLKGFESVGHLLDHLKQKNKNAAVKSNLTQGELFDLTRRDNQTEFQDDREKAFNEASKIKGVGHELRHHQNSGIYQGMEQKPTDNLNKLEALDDVIEAPAKTNRS